MKSLTDWHFLLSASAVRPPAPGAVGANLARAASAWATERGLGVGGGSRLPRPGDPAGELVFDFILTGPGRMIPQSQAAELLEWLHRWAEPRGLALCGGFGEYPMVEPEAEPASADGAPDVPDPGA
jgi:hypothetical protein